MLPGTALLRLSTLASGLALAGALAVAAPQAAQAADKYGFDKPHTKVLFVYNHVGLSNQYGRFDDVDGEIMFDQAKPQNSKVNVTIKTASIDTDVEALDKHLMSKDFFNAEAHPKITFVSTAVRKTGTKTGQVEGNLTMNGQTKPVTLDVTFNFAGEHPLSPYSEKYKGAQYASFSAKASLLRSAFGLGMFAPLTSDEVDIIIETELRKAE